MNNDFETMMADGIEDLQTAFGENATYTPPGGEAQTITLDEFDEVEAPDLQDRRDGQIEARKASAILRQSEVTAPALGASVTRSSTSENWKLESFVPVDGGDGWRWTLKRTDAREKFAPAGRIGM